MLTHGEARGGESACNSEGFSRPTRRCRRSQESRIVRPLHPSCNQTDPGRRRNVTNRRQGYILRRAYRQRRARGRTAGVGESTDAHDNLQTTVSNMFVEHLYDSMHCRKCRDPLEPAIFHIARYRLKIDVISGRPMHICVHARRRDR